MLDYCKLILQKVSFNRGLFHKELRKAVVMLQSDEVPQLKVWCLITFSAAYADVIQDVFGSFTK